MARNRSKEITDYVHALSSGDSSILKELTLNRGYDEEFNVPEMPLMNETSDERLVFYAATGLMAAYIGGPTVSHKMAVKRIMEAPPKDYWERHFNDEFTYLKRTEGGINFVDCWHEKGKDKLKISTGLFPTRERLTEEAHLITNLVEIREGGLSSRDLFFYCGFLPLIITYSGSFLGTVGGEAFGREIEGALIGAGVGLIPGVKCGLGNYLSIKREREEKEKTIALGETAIERLVMEGQ